ncbi:MAG: hypothetical protein ACR2RD_03440 [Woeseiaceae bacterium]
MSPYRWTRAGIIGFLLIATSLTQANDKLDPLFQSSAILDVRIAAPISTILKERSDVEDVPGKFRYTDDAGELIDVDIGIRTRGISRLKRDVCPFPPLRLDFKKSQIKKSLLHKQDKLKLVTHCRDRSSRYQQTVLNEYLAYRILNELTDVSFAVRLLRITYIDTDGRDKDRVRYGFLIEHKNRLAKRHDLQPLALEKTTVKSLQPEYTNLISVFHFLIGNTDFSPIAGPNAACCHNHVLMGEEGSLLLSVPYDLDQSGIVDAPHGVTNPRFKLRSARQRLYRGRCVNNAYLDQTLAVYRDKREGIYAIIGNQEGFEEKYRKKMTKFLDGFYKIIDSPKLVERHLLTKCI